MNLEIGKQMKNSSMNRYVMSNIEEPMVIFMGLYGIEVKKEENRIKRENIWKKRTVSTYFGDPFPEFMVIFLRLMPSLKRQWQLIGGEEHRGSLAEAANCHCWGLII